MPCNAVNAVFSALPLTVSDSVDTVPCNAVNAVFSALPLMVDIRFCAVGTDVTPSALKYDSCLAMSVLLACASFAALSADSFAFCAAVFALFAAAVAVVVLVALVYI